MTEKEEAIVLANKGEQWAVQAVMILRQTIALEDEEHRKQAARAQLPEAAPI